MKGTGLRNWRIRHKLTQAEAAARFSISQEMWAQMESGAKAIPDRIAEATRTRLSDIMGDMKPRGPYRK